MSDNIAPRLEAYREGFMVYFFLIESKPRHAVPDDIFLPARCRQFSLQCLVKSTSC